MVSVTHRQDSADVMLVYILLGSGVLLVALLGLFSWLYFRRRKQNQVSRSKEITGSHRPFRIRSTHKGCSGPTMPAIHDMIFNGLVSDGDSGGGFSNRAISDPKVFEAADEYQIPVDFIDSLATPDVVSNRNSFSQLTEGSLSVQGR